MSEEANKGKEKRREVFENSRKLMSQAKTKHREIGTVKKYSKTK